MSFKDFFRGLLFRISDKMAMMESVPSIPNTILLVRVDAIGDYILFRNFIRLIKQQGKYKGYRIILCGNIIWSNLAQELDKEYIDDFIWVDKKKMVRNVGYRYKKLKQIHRLGVSVAIQPTYSRDFYSGDSIIKASGAVERIGSSADMTILTWEQKMRSDRYYTKLINISRNTLFEFDRNKEIIFQLTGESIDRRRPCIDASAVSAKWFKPGKGFVAICPSASNDTKKWDTIYYAELCRSIIDEFALNIVIVGGKEDGSLAEKIMRSLDKDHVTDLTGKTTLSELTAVLSKAKLVVSNDTAAAHIAAATGVPVICVSRGDHFGRFTKYPDNDGSVFITIYPDELMQRLNDNDFLKNNFQYKSPLDINSIRVNDVQKLVREILKK